MRLGYPEIAGVGTAVTHHVSAPPPKTALGKRKTSGDLPDKRGARPCRQASH